MRGNIHLNGLEVQKYHEFLVANAQDNTEYSEVYQTLADEMAKEVKTGFNHTMDDGFTRINVYSDDYGGMDMDFHYDAETSLKLMDLMIKHRAVFMKIVDFVHAGIKLISGFGTMFKEMNQVIAGCKAQKNPAQYKTGTND